MCEHGNVLALAEELLTIGGDDGKEDYTVGGSQ